MNFIDNFLDKITMYRLVAYYLTLLLSAALILSFFSFLPFSPVSLIISALFIIAVCRITNKIFARRFAAAANIESVYISALILCLLINPAESLQDFLFLFLVSVLAMASKYLLVIRKKHIFNPVAIALVLANLTVKGTASWWVGALPMLPFVLLGLLIVIKIRRWNLVFCFLLTVFFVILGLSLINGSNIFTALNALFLDSPLLFFSFIMLTEPLTTPSVKFLQSVYGIISGFTFFITPEIALVLGNIFSFAVSSKEKLILKLGNKMKIGADVFDFTFNLNKKFNFTPGQYMEWTLTHGNSDSRGNRRYFTIASSPTESNLRLGIKFYSNGSSFKKALTGLDQKTRLIGSQLAGEFILPKEVSRKLVFIAGGIGITPFRSMIKYLLDKGERRDIVLLYSNKLVSEIMYADVWNSAGQNLGIKTVYTLTEKYPVDWKGRTGRIDAKMIEGEVPDWKERYFYLSGPHGMVAGFEQTLKNMGVGSSQIKIDFFPGFV